MIARLAFVLACCSAHAEELTICYNYGCAATAKIMLSVQDLEELRVLFRDTHDAATERLRLSKAVGWMQFLVAQKSPTGNDRPGNYADDAVNGRMDCIDHSTNSTTYLNLLQSVGLVRHHRVLAPVMRAPWLVNVHWAARIADAGGREFAVDSWAAEPGSPIPIVPLGAWLKGEDA